MQRYAVYYLWKLLYMFRVVSPPIIRSTYNCIYSICYLSNCNSLTSTRCCRYSCMCSWWWVEIPPETCRAVSRDNKLRNVVSCWIYIRIHLFFLLNCNWLCGNRYCLREMHISFAEMTQLFCEIMTAPPPSYLNSAYTQATGRYLKPFERSYCINDKILSFRCFRYKYIPKVK